MIRFFAKSSFLFIAVLLFNASIRVAAQGSPSTLSITSITPAEFHVGDIVVIAGAGFDISSTTNNKVYFNNEWYVSPPLRQYDSIKATVLSVTDQALTVLVPAGAGAGNISVSAGGQVFSGLNDAPVGCVCFNVVPTLTAVIPDTGFVGDTITITGTGFDPLHPWNNKIWFTNGFSAEAFSSTATSLRVVVPTLSSTGPITVFTNFPRVISDFIFNVPVTIVGIEPNEAQVGNYVYIEGTGFDPSQVDAYEVKFNGISAKIVFVTGSEINVQVPKHAWTGPVTLSFKGAVAASSGQNFIVTPTNPGVTDYSVHEGTVGTPVAIFGHDFDQGGPPLSVTFSGNVDAKIDHYSQDTIYTSVPRGAQTGAISVTAGGLSTFGYSYFIVKESLLSMEPRHASVGDTIRIKGLGFSPSPYYYLIRFANAIVVHPTSATDSTLTLVLPSDAVSCQPVIYSDDNLGVFIKLPYLNVVPVITSIKPDTVITGRKMKIEIQGTGFNRSNPNKRSEVTFTNNVKQQALSNTSTSIGATVPNTAVSGSVSVRIDSISSSAFNFIILPDTFPYTPPPPQTNVTSVTTTTFQYNWNSGYRVLGYIIDLSANNFETFLPGYKSLVLTDTSKMISGLSAGTRYYFRIRAYSDTDTSDYSSGYLVTVPPPPVVASAINVSSSGFTCRWYSSKGAENYLVDVTVNRFVDFKSATVTDTTVGVYIISGLPSSFQYRVRAANSWGISEYSKDYYVITEDALLPKAVTLYPNPVVDQVFISGLNLPMVESNLIDIAGKITPVRTQYVDGEVIAFDFRELSPGVYILQLADAKSIRQIKFIKK